MILPLALIGLVSLPIIVAFYMLRLRRRDCRSASRSCGSSSSATSRPTRRGSGCASAGCCSCSCSSRRSSCSPRRARSADDSDLAANVVLIVDTPHRWRPVRRRGLAMALARRAAADVVGRLPEGGRVTVVAAADDRPTSSSARPMTGPPRSQAIDGITATQLPGRPDRCVRARVGARGARLRLDGGRRQRCERRRAAGGRASGRPCWSSASAQPMRTRSVAALSALRRSGGAQLDLFVAVSQPIDRRGDATAGDLRRRRRWSTRASWRFRPGSVPRRWSARVPPSAATIEARLAGSDALATDDRAFAIVPAQGRTRALLVGDGNAYLENAMALLPRLELYAVGDEGYADALAEAAATRGRRTGSSSSTASSPTSRRPAPRCTSTRRRTASSARSPGGSRVRSSIAPTRRSRSCDSSTCRASTSVVRVRSPSLTGVRSVVDTGAGRPLVAVGERDGRRLGLIGFDLGEVRPAAAGRLPASDEQPRRPSPAGGGWHPAIVDAAGHVGDRSRRSRHRARQRRDHRRRRGGHRGRGAGRRRTAHPVPAPTPGRPRGACRQRDAAIGNQSSAGPR